MYVLITDWVMIENLGGGSLLEEDAQCGIPLKGIFCPQPLPFLLSGYEVSAFLLLHISAMMDCLPFHRPKRQ